MPPGSYALGDGNAVPAGPCAAGYFCSGRAIAERPRNASSGGGKCGPGSACVAGSVRDVPCAGGAYCDSRSTVGVCAAGYWCGANATSPEPPEGEYGGRCPPGAYCPAGSPAPVACPPGTFRADAGGEARGDCAASTAGYLGANASTAALTARCPAGAYCPAGSVVGVACPPGSSCAAGAAANASCAPGTYAQTRGLASCDRCPPGSYCGAGAAAYAACPPGHFCPEATPAPDVFPCPNGTYSNATRRSREGECAPCDAGAFCNDTGLSAPAGRCAAGFFCASGSVVPDPRNTW